METPPETLDGARVLQVANLAGAQPTGKTLHVGFDVNSFAALAIAQYEAEPSGVYLFYCDADWNVMDDTWHEDVDAASEQANFEFRLLNFVEV